MATATGPLSYSQATSMGLMREKSLNVIVTTILKIVADALVELHGVERRVDILHSIKTGLDEHFPISPPITRYYPHLFQGQRVSTPADQPVQPPADQASLAHSAL